MAAAVSCQAQAPRLKPVECRSKNSGLVAPWFDLTGLDGPLGRVADACGWSTRGSGSSERGESTDKTDFFPASHLSANDLAIIMEGLQNLYAGVRFSPAPPIFPCSSLQSLRLLLPSASSSAGLDRPHSAKFAALFITVSNASEPATSESLARAKGYARTDFDRISV